MPSDRQPAPPHLTSPLPPIKEMVKTGGINVASLEVEEILLGHPEVEQAYVIGVPDAGRDEAGGVQTHHLRERLTAEPGAREA